MKQAVQLSQTGLDLVLRVNGCRCYTSAVFLPFSSTGAMRYLLLKCVHLSVCLSVTVRFCI